MEVKINREIRNYTESMFFGLSMRQFIFSVLACGVAVGLYFILRPYFGVETLSWMCILGAAPFAMLGFITYHGMTAEQFIWAWLRSEMLEPKEFKFEDSNYYYAALKDTIEELQTGRPGKKRRKEPKHFSKRKEAKGTGTHRVRCCQKHTPFGIGSSETPGAATQYRQETKTA